MPTELIEHTCFKDKVERDNYVYWLELNGYMVKKYYKPQHYRLVGDSKRYCLMIVDMQAPIKS